MKKRIFPFLFSMAVFASHLSSQVEIKPGYDFEMVKTISCTPVKSQGRTGTCWSFATSSFLESEAIRNGKSSPDFSEMYVVRNVYKDKAQNYVLRQGKANFSQGSLSHDLMRVVGKYGVVPETVYTGKETGTKRHDHSEMEAVLKGMLDGVLKQKRPSLKWKQAFNKVVDVYLGEESKEFKHEGKTYTPATYAKEMGINADDYVNITSFAHHPFYQPFILEIPDNYSNGSFYNLPIEDVQAIVENAVTNGYSVAWDGDVSEKGFSSRDGLAILPQDAKRKNKFTKPGKEISVNQALRQSTFMNYSTTDDHLMHIVGTAKDQNGTKYYIIKNSWGEISDYKGYLYMSEAYLRLKTVGILVNKNSVPKNVMNKLEM